jgi:hypothetical protein
LHCLQRAPTFSSLNIKTVSSRKSDIIKMKMVNVGICGSHSDIEVTISLIIKKQLNHVKISCSLGKAQVCVLLDKQLMKRSEYVGKKNLSFLLI